MVMERTAVIFSPFEAQPMPLAGSGLDTMRSLCRSETRSLERQHLLVHLGANLYKVKGPSPSANHLYNSRGAAKAKSSYDRKSGRAIGSDDYINVALCLK